MRALPKGADEHGVRQMESEDHPVPLITGGPLTPLTHHMFVSTLRKCLQHVGVDTSQYSAHSFRRGGATFAHWLGVDPLLIKRMSDWRSDAYMRHVGQQNPEGLVRLPQTLTAACVVYEQPSAGGGVGRLGWGS